MKKIKGLLVAGLAMVSMSAVAQTAEEIVAKNIAAMGGIDKLKSLNSVKMEGSLSAQGMDIPMTITRLKDKGLRVDIEVMGTANYQVANATKGVIFMPVMGHSEPQDMSAPEFAGAKDQMNLVGTLASYKEAGAKIEYAGVEDVNGSPAHKIKLTKANGESTNYFIDQKTSFVIKTSSKREVQGQEMEVETGFRDYKQNDQGYWFPYTQSTMSGDISYSKISTNITVDEKIFQQ